MATVKQCDCCGKVYNPSTKSNDYRFRISDTEPTLHILDLCYDCLAKVEALMGGRKHTPGWKNQPHVKAKRQTAGFAQTVGTPVNPPVLSGMPVSHNTPCPETGMENEVTMHNDKTETKVNVVVPPSRSSEGVVSLPDGVNGLYRPEAAPCCCEVGACGNSDPMTTYDPSLDAIKILDPATGKEETIYQQSHGTTLGEIYPDLGAQVEESK